MSGATLELKQVDVAYGSRQVLQKISLQVKAGEFIALLGPSGCGKTTLLRAIAGFQSLRGGQILLDGRDIAPLPPEQRDVAMVFQSYALWPHMNVAANIGYGLKLRGVPRPQIRLRVNQLLEQLGLEELGTRRIGQLSGGQRQRVALGRALAVDPDMLLLDEPLSNLDAQIRLQLRHRLRALQQRLGVTAILVTHDREEAMAMADRIAVIEAGQVVQFDTPENLYHHPRTETVAGLMGADNRLLMHWKSSNRERGTLVAETGEVVDVALATTTRSGVQHSGRLPLAGPVALRFRAANAHLLRADEGAPGEGVTLPCRIVSGSYLGERYRYQVQCAGQTLLVDDSRLLQPNTPLHLWLAHEHLYLFCRAAEGEADEGAHASTLSTTPPALAQAT